MMYGMLFESCLISLTVIEFYLVMKHIGCCVVKECLAILKVKDQFPIKYLYSVCEKIKPILLITHDINVCRLREF